MTDIAKINDWVCLKLTPYRWNPEFLKFANSNIAKVINIDIRTYRNDGVKLNFYNEEDPTTIEVNYDEILEFGTKEQMIITLEANKYNI